MIFGIRGEKYEAEYRDKTVNMKGMVFKMKKAALLFAAVSACLLLSVPAYGLESVSARDERLQTSGAQIRIPDDSGEPVITQGLRFVSTIQKSLYDSVQKPQSENDTGLGFGTVVFPTKLLDGDDLRKDTVKNGLHAAVVPAVKLKGEPNETEAVFTACMTGFIPDAETYTTEYTVVSYATYMDGETEVTVYGEPYSTGIYEVALAAVSSGKESKEVTQYLFDTIVHVVDGHTAASPVKENEIAGTCKAEGSYDEVTYCSVCRKELSRIKKSNGFGDHRYVNGKCEVCGEAEVVSHEPTIKVESVTVQSGENTVTVPISVENNPGIASLKIRVGYDDKIVLQNVSFTSLFGAYITAATPYTNPQIISMMSPLSDIGDDGIFANLKFDVSELGDGEKASITLEYDTYDTFDSEFNYVTFSVTNGEISKNAGHSEENHTPGAPVKENEIAGTCKVEGSYDEVTYCSVCRKELNRIKKSSGFGDHRYINGKCEVCGETEATAEPTIQVESVTVQSGENTVIVPISVKNNPGIASLKIRVKYDDKIVLQNISFTSLFGAYITAATPYTNPQIISMMSPLSDIGDDGIFANLKFDVSGLGDGEKASITLEYDTYDTFDSEFNYVTFSVTNGEISK